MCLCPQSSVTPVYGLMRITIITTHENRSPILVKVGIHIASQTLVHFSICKS